RGCREGAGGGGVKPFRDVASAGARARSSIVRHADAAETANQLAERVAKSSRPLVVIGLGVDSRNAARIRRWVNEWNLPVAVTPKVKGIVDETAANFVGVAGGMAADGLMCDALAAADLLIGFGLDPVEIDKTWHAELPIQWILEAPNAGEIVPAGAELVDAAQLLDGLVRERRPRAWDAPFRKFQRTRRDMLADRTAQSGTMWPGDIIGSLAAVCPPQTIVTTDV